MKTVIVGMSGGVDSSVSAYLLKKEGYRVIGLFMKNWEEEDENGVCTSSLEYEDVLRTAEEIGIPCYSVNFAKEYKEQVFSEFLSDLKKGLTPNPDVLCNREIKFKVFWEKAKELGGDFLATGHYCRRDEKGRLLKGLDPTKDQSYFLHAVKSSVLKNVLFPIGHLQKSEVRTIAKELSLSVQDKKDSTGICFIGKRNFKEFVSPYLGYTPGNFENTKGEVLGTHDGCAFYTIGQRKGICLGGKGDAFFVVGKDLQRNVVVIEQGKDHPALYKRTLIAHDLTWIDTPPTLPHTCAAKIRYRQEDQACTLQKSNQQLLITFNNPQRAITPGQSIVFYDGEVCLGGGKIGE